MMFPGIAVVERRKPRCCDRQTTVTATLMSNLHPIIPAQEDPEGSHVAAEPPTDDVPITEAEVGEYREQDRFLPVRSCARVTTFQYSRRIHSRA
jgi:hypothetical protein